jgi:site-specific DNA-methyltransferase (adenine-specific)
MKIVNIKTAKLIPYINNPRNNVAAIDKVAASIKEFGFQQPIVIDDENVIIAGHTRYLAAQKLGLSEVPVTVAKDLSDYQIKAYRIADNRVAQESSWDDELLQIELGDLESNDYDLELTGFDADEIQILLNGPDYEPASIDAQNNLDQLEPIYCVCPKCGAEFDSRENKA